MSGGEREDGRWPFMPTLSSVRRANVRSCFRTLIPRPSPPFVCMKS